MATKKQGLPKTSDYEPQIVAPGHPLRSRDDLVYPHRDVLFRTIGPGVHLCHWCERRIEWRGVFFPGWIVSRTDAHGRHRVDIDATAEQRPAESTVDHLDGRPRNNRASNVVPACRACNFRRALAGNPLFFGKRTRAEFVAALKALAQRLRRSFQLREETRSRLMTALRRLIPRLRTDEKPTTGDYDRDRVLSKHPPPRQAAEPEHIKVHELSPTGQRALWHELIDGLAPALADTYIQRHNERIPTDV